MIEAAAALRRLVAGDDLTGEEMESLVGRLMDGELGEPQQAGLLVALAAKGESPAEIAGAARAMRRRVVRIPHHREKVVDTCGTGGDGQGTFNVSTAAALIAAAAGVPVAKHGNRSVSSRSGSADVLEALGVDLQTDPQRAGRSLDEIGIAFLFAPRLHPAMRQVMPVRRALGIRTVFNLLGPLTNPAGASRQLLGVYAPRLVEPIARVLAELGCERALVVHGDDGLDEITNTGPTRVAELSGSRVTTRTLEPEELGVERAAAGALEGGDPKRNAAVMLEVLAGAPGPYLDVSLLNAGAAIWVGGLAESGREGVELARRAVASGAAAAKLAELEERSRGDG